MTQKEDFEKRIWAVLQRIKEHVLYRGDKESPSLAHSGSWNDEKIDDQLLLEKLQDLRVIKNLQCTKHESFLSSFDFDLVQPKFDNLYDDYEKRFTDNQSDALVEFDMQAGVLTYKDRRHAFHGGKGDDVRLRLFRELWEHRRTLRGERVVIAGESRMPETLAVNVGITDSAQRFIRDTRAKEGLAAMFKDMNRILRKKRLPVSIQRRGGIQLEVRE